MSEVASSALMVVCLTEVLKERYCAEVNDGKEQRLPGSIAMKLPARPKLCTMERLGLENMQITHSGSLDLLSSLCPAVHTLSLANNSLNGWAEVDTILMALPQLRSLDLSRNLTLSSSSSTLSSHSQLQAFVLNKTELKLKSVISILHNFPSLIELHVHQNGYRDTDIFEASTSSYSASSNPLLSRLHIDSNHLTSWDTVQHLNALFPHLETLIISDNPFLILSPLPEQCFPKLKSLFLDNTGLSEWETLEYLQQLPILVHLSIQNVPIGLDLDEKHHRFAIIARLPLLKKLNKSDINEDEREDAERWLVRQYEGCPPDKQPKVYSELIKKHGIVNQLADVDLSPPRRARITLYIDNHMEKSSQERTISLLQNTKQFKQWLSKNVVHVSPSRMKLFYGDTEFLDTLGLCRMIYDCKMLYSYRIKDGDQIHVRVY